VVAITAGIRESETSWTELLLDLKKRGLTIAPELAVGDGALGFWKALEKVFPNTRRQRCWVHKTVNVLDKLPKSQQSKAKGLLHDIWMAETRKDAEVSFDHFLEVYEVKWPRAAECLRKDREDLLAFYDFPAEHWSHIRTTNPIESTFATIRLRTKRTKGHGSAKAAIAMAFKLAECAAKRWRKLNGSKLLADVIDLNVVFVDGIRKAA
jgi:transposase-like protein